MADEKTALKDEREGRIMRAAVDAYWQPGDTAGTPKQVVDAVRPLIAAEALRQAAQAAERMSIVYDQDSDDGWRAWMRNRADELEHSKLCSACGQLAYWIDCPTGGWWKHVDHPADEHDAVVEAAA